MDEKGVRGFYVAYKDNLFKAYAYNADRERYTLREVDFGLEELLRKCKDAGFDHVEGMTSEAIDVIYEWLTKAERVFNHVEGLWEGKGGVPHSIGFRPHWQVEADIKAPERADLECYGITPTPPSDYVVTNEMVNEIRDELGI